MAKPAFLSMADFEAQPPAFKTLTPEMETGTVCARLIIHFATIVFLVIPAIDVPLPLVYHFVSKCVAEPLWTEPLVVEFNLTPGAPFAPTASALSIFQPDATTPGLFYGT